VQVALLKEIGFDYAFNYRTTDTAAALAEAAPDGISIYFDNVGGKVLEDALTASRNNGRIVACGQISTYDAPEEKRYGVRNLFYVSAAVLGYSLFLGCLLVVVSLRHDSADLQCVNVCMGQLSEAGSLPLSGAAMSVQRAVVQVVRQVAAASRLHTQSRRERAVAS
jgi:hypothetical protein